MKFPLHSSSNHGTQKYSSVPNIGRRNILFVATRLPYPLIGGDRVKCYHVLQHLAKNNNVTLLTLHQGGDAPQNKLTPLEDLGIRVISIPHNPIVAGLKSVSSIYTKKPLEISYYQNTRLSATISELIATEKFDIAMGFFMRGGEYIRNIPLKKILIAEDCRTLYTKRSLDSTPLSYIHQKLIRTFELRTLLNYEKDIMLDFDKATFVTNEDLIATMRLQPNGNYGLVSNGTTIDAQALETHHKNRQDIIFTGKLDVWANTMMVHKIITTILPIIRHRLPNVQVHIVGGHPPISIVRLVKKTPGVHLYANVEDIRKYLRNAAVFLHPHDGGSGIQNKVLEALGSGCAVVSTPTGVHGIPAWHNRHIMIGSNDQELASYCIRLLENPDLRQSMAEESVRLINRQFSWEAILSDLDTIMCDVLQVPKPYTHGQHPEVFSSDITMPKSDFISSLSEVSAQLIHNQKYRR